MGPRGGLSLDLHCNKDSCGKPKASCASSLLQLSPSYTEKHLSGIQGGTFPIYPEEAPSIICLYYEMIERKMRDPLSQG